jgi:hypothetical protein
MFIKAFTINKGDILFQKKILLLQLNGITRSVGQTSPNGKFIISDKKRFIGFYNKTIDIYDADAVFTGILSPMKKIAYRIEKDDLEAYGELTYNDNNQYSIPVTLTKSTDKSKTNYDNSNNAVELFNKTRTVEPPVITEWSFYCYPNPFN